MGREGFEPSTLGLRVAPNDLNGSRPSWIQAGFGPSDRIESRPVSVGLVAPLLPRRRTWPYACATQQALAGELSPPSISCRRRSARTKTRVRCELADAVSGDALPDPALCWGRSLPFGGAPPLTSSTTRVAAYVREPHATKLRSSARAREAAIRQAGPFLESLGWTSLEYRDSEWDDDAQQGKAFYIHFLGLPPGGEPSELTRALGAVDCIAFTPNLKRTFWARGPRS